MAHTPDHSAYPMASPRALQDWRAFLKAFLRDPRQVASVAPSSARLARRVACAADVHRARTIVELGPGTGVTTRALLGAMAPDARLLAIELNPALHAHLAARITDPRLALELASAEQLAQLLQTRRLPAPDVVVAGIPFSTLPDPVAGRIAAAIAACLAPGGRFVAYQLRDDVARWMTPHLGTPRVAWEWFNLPPLRRFRWVKTELASRQLGTTRQI